MLTHHNIISDLDKLMKEYKVSLRVYEEDWTSVVTISSAAHNIVGLYQCRKKFLQILRLIPDPLPVKKSKKKLTAEHV